MKPLNAPVIFTGVFLIFFRIIERKNEIPNDSKNFSTIFFFTVETHKVTILRVDFSLFP